MGRRKQKHMLFVQGDSLAEEVESDDEQSGGLHIGNVVVLRAPMSSRTRMSAGLTHRGSTGRQAAGGRATDGAAARATHSTVQHEMSEQVLITDSDASLDEELKDYLDNVKQADGRSSDTEDASDEQQFSTTANDWPAAAAAATVTAGGRLSHSSSWEDWDDSSRSRPGLGFHSAAAAARFTDVSLDTALEGLLARDFLQTGLDKSDTSSSDNSGNDSDSSSSRSDGSEAGAAGLHTPLDIAGLNTSTVLVVDAEGQAMAVWDQLPLQHRFPVQTRQQQCSSLQITWRTGGNSSSTKNAKHKKDSKDRRTPSRSSSGANHGLTSSAAAAAARLEPPDMPCFAHNATTTAAKAAYAAAAAAADLESVQRQQHRKQQRSVATGANRGQLLPGEKKKLRKEKIAAKRAVRRGERGQGALALLAAVEAFALSGGDMTLLPPCGKHKQAFTRSVAALYGIKASAQGGSSSGKTNLVLMSTANTAPLDADSAVQLQRLLVAELAQEMVAAAVAEGPVAGGRQGSAPGQRGDRPDSRRSSGQGLPRQRSRGAAAAAAAAEESVFQQPVAFVPAGVLDPNSSSTRLGQQQQQQPDSIETEAQQTCTAQGRAAAAAGVHVHVHDAATYAAAAAEAVKGAAADAFVRSLFLDDERTYCEAEISRQPDMQQQQQVAMLLHQQQPVQPAWVIDKEPSASVPQHTGLGFGHSSITTAAAAAAVTSCGSGCTLVAAEGHGAPLYDRPAMNLGLGFGVGTVGVVQQQKGAGSITDMTMDNTAAAAQLHGTVDSSEGNQRLRELEDKFAALQAAANPAAAKRQQRRQQQQDWQQQHRQGQQRVEARLSAPNTALGPVVPAAVIAGPRVIGSDDEEGIEPAGVITLGLTKQQVKKAKKQQQRNARREARTAAAAENDAQAAAAAVAVAGNVSGGFAGFEAHTRGIGSRLMAGWGWREGEGLGRTRQGRPEPLLAARRARNQGLGAE